MTRMQCVAKRLQVIYSSTQNRFSPPLNGSIRKFRNERCNSRTGESSNEGMSRTESMKSSGVLIAFPSISSKFAKVDVENGFTRRTIERQDAGRYPKPHLLRHQTYQLGGLGRVNMQHQALILDFGYCAPGAFEASSLASHFYAHLCSSSEEKERGGHFYMRIWISDCLSQVNANCRC